MVGLLAWYDPAFEYWCSLCGYFMISNPKSHSCFRSIQMYNVDFLKYYFAHWCTTCNFGSNSKVYEKTSLSINAQGLSNFLNLIGLLHTQFSKSKPLSLPLKFHLPSFISHLPLLLNKSRFKVFFHHKFYYSRKLTLIPLQLLQLQVLSNIHHLIWFLSFQVPVVDLKNQILSTSFSQSNTSWDVQKKTVKQLLFNRNGLAHYIFSQDTSHLFIASPNQPLFAGMENVKYKFL